MARSAAPATAAWDTAVELTAVSKTFYQQQRAGDLRDALKNFFHPRSKEIRALDAVSLNIKRGEFVAYAGPNGAGKSTTIKLLCGMLMPDAGQVKAMGLSPEKNRAALMRRMGVLFGNRTELWWDHPILSSFAWKREVWNIPDATYRRMLADVTERLEIGGLLNTFARELSLGQRMRCELALMLLHNPELILLDEPTLGLDVLAKRQMIEYLRTLGETYGTTVLVTSHDMDDLAEMAQRVILISNGRIALDSTFDRLRQTNSLKRLVRARTASLTPPALKTARYAGSEGTLHTYAFEPMKTPVREVLKELSEIPSISDVELAAEPLEAVIASLYKSWRTEPQGS
ncbi:MAG: ATP-binding cassette domain-containing protein [Clostridiaceae bacterium]|nr:ATP-binding cassette domain-containing protein [Eubacteriales bacterium]